MSLNQCIDITIPVFVSIISGAHVHSIDKYSTSHIFICIKLFGPTLSDSLMYSYLSWLVEVNASYIDRTGMSRALKFV